MESSPSVIMCEGEWESFSGMYEINDESEFMTQLLGECIGKMSSNADLKVYSSDPSSSNACFYSQEISTYRGRSNGSSDMSNFLFGSGHGDYNEVKGSNHRFESDTIPCYYSSVDFEIEKEENVSSTAFICTDLMMQLDEDSTQPKNITKAEPKYDDNLKMKFEVPQLNNGSKIIGTRSLPVDVKKRPRNVEDQKNKRNVKTRRGKKITETTGFNEEKSKQATSSDCSKDDASALSDIKSVDVSTMTMDEELAPSSRNGKTRANRGSATDPQSLYARKRREKINERLRILQGLVPNGTKVDISTMLDEAVQYVKFLQLQIKLLSSDDMWMYAPLAYNGMDLGLDI